VRLAVIAAALASGCVARTVEDIEIKCSADSECPTGAFCDLSTGGNVCHELAVEDLPHVLLDGFVIGDGVVATIEVPREAITLRKLRLHNDTRRSLDIAVDVSAIACVHADALANPDGYTIDRMRTLDITFSVHPDASCPSPVALVVTVTADGRAFMFQRAISFTPLAQVDPFRQ
jgi:hypothetical protein